MIKFTGTYKDGRRLLGIGLSRENIRRLQEDQPILFEASLLGFDGYVLIIAGENEWEMAAAIQPLVQSPFDMEAPL